MSLSTRLKKTLNQVLPRHTLRSAFSLWELGARLIYRGGQCYCPICQSQIRKFLPTGQPRRENAVCPVCRSKERHRVDWLFFQQKSDLFDGTSKRMLHVAPELALEMKLQRLPHLDYVTADMNNPRAMVKMDITDIPMADASFSVIYCSHVLEHVPDDKQALSEFYRVLKPGGWALLQVPLFPEPTFEDATITDPQERLRVFGQVDHVRRCGPDYINRMAIAGFETHCFSSADLITDEQDCVRLGISKGQAIFFCQKPVQ